MHLGTSNSRFTYHIMKEAQQIDLQITELEKDLGIHMDPKLTFSTQEEEESVCGKQDCRDDQAIIYSHRRTLSDEAVHITREATSRVWKWSLEPNV